MLDKSASSGVCDSLTRARSAHAITAPAWGAAHLACHARLLASLVRMYGFRFEDVARDLRGHVRDAANGRDAFVDEKLSVHGWAPPARLITAEQCRLRWVEIDRRLCLGASQPAGLRASPDRDGDALLEG